ncbi:MAG: RNA polymerase sigma factor [Lachnospiraceae bacterium]|nr:RNA polymerase sigma factor [Lachnospiraceae bacterium]
MKVKEAEALYHKYFAAVYSICFLYMKNEADACDMVQETFLQLLQGRFTYQSQEKTKAWLIVTASNCCKKQLRKSWRKKQVAYDAALHDRGKEDPDNLLLRMVEELEEKYRLPVYLYYFEGYHSAEIAKILHVNASTIRSRLAKARELLRLELAPEKNLQDNIGRVW